MVIKRQRYLDKLAKIWRNEQGRGCGQKLGHFDT